MGLIVIFLVPLILAIAGVLVVLGLRRSSRAAGDADPSSGTCGACGYSMKGSVGLNCPECGADLLIAGIRPAGRGGKGVHPGVFIAIVIAVMLPLLSICAGALLWTKSGSVAAPPAANPPKLQTVPVAPQPVGPDVDASEGSTGVGTEDGEE